MFALRTGIINRRKGLYWNKLFTSDNSVLFLETDRNFCFGFGYDIETGDIFSFGYGRNRGARIRPYFDQLRPKIRQHFGVNQNCLFSLFSCVFLYMFMCIYIVFCCHTL